MNISRLAFAHRPVVLTMVVALMLLGVQSYFTVPAQEDPMVSIREAVVTTRFPGLSPERMELLVTKRLEESIRQIAEVKEINSTSKTGVSIIHVTLHDHIFVLDQIWDDLRSKVGEAAAGLPAGSGTPQVNTDFGDVSVITAAITANGFDMSAVYDVAQHVRDRLFSVPGTKRIDIHGAQEERIFVEVENARMSALGVDTALIVNALTQQNTIQPGGVIDVGERVFLIQPSGNFDAIDDIKEVLIRAPDSDIVFPLRDVATVSRGFIDPPAQRAYVDGKPAIILAIAMLDGYRVLDYAPQVKALLEEIEDTLPWGYAIDIVTYQAEQVENAVFGVTASVLQTLFIVLGVVILFLGLRTGLIVGSIVPAVMLITIAVMGLAGIPLERMSLATLVIALGLLVDNGIVIAEDFKRRLEAGASRDAALAATGRELAMPLLSATLTTILVFLPLMMAQHSAGEYTRSISLVILISLSVSWLLAMMLTPMLCHRFIRLPASTADGQTARFDLFAMLERGYAVFLRGLLRVRVAFLLLMFIGLGFAGYSMQFVPQSFFPESDRAQILVYLDLPADVSSRKTDETMRAILDGLGDETAFPYLRTVAGYVGYGGPRFVLSLTPIDTAANRGFIVGNLDDHASLDRAIADFRAYFGENHPGVLAEVTSMFLGPSDPRILEVKVAGPDADFIYSQAVALVDMLNAIPGTTDVKQNWENRITKIAVDVDQQRALRAGVTSTDVAETLAAYFSGRSFSQFREGDEIFPIVARATGEERSDLDAVRALNVYPASGGPPVPLVQIADFRLVNEFAAIQRTDLTRTLTVQARNTFRSPEDLVPVIAPKLADLQAQMPPGHTIGFTGIITDSQDGRAALFANLPLAFAGIVVLLVAQFNSFKRPAIILLTIPLMLIGAATGLHLMRADFGFIVILGLFSLGGIIINNAIVLIDRIDIERAMPGADAFDAIVSASARRLRPIVMTTVTTILGLLPLIVARDPLFYGMATVIAFGLGVGTILTLGVVPVLYSLMFAIRQPRRGPALQQGHALKSRMGSRAQGTA